MELFGSKVERGTKVSFLESVWPSEDKPRSREEASLAGVVRPRW